MLNKRALPWRTDFEPYTVWLSEIMLQQTQVVTVIDYFNRFVKAYPTVQKLARANEEEVFKLWEGLGYYSRVRNLMRCAKIIVEQYDGIFPMELKKLLKLPGIGPYTAGAISSIAFNQQVAAVDGNVMRVISRYRTMDIDISDTKNRIVFEDEVLALMGDNARDFNQALMELGATVCTPKQPKCLQCPVNNECKAFEQGTMECYPVKLKKVSKKLMEMAVIILQQQDKVLIVKRPNTGLMPNLWGFPVVENVDETAEARVQNYMQHEFGLEVSVLKVDDGAKHIFTHLIWDMQLYRCILKDSNTAIKPIEFPETQWVKPQKFSEYAFPTAFRKLFQLI